VLYSPYAKVSERQPDELVRTNHSTLSETYTGGPLDGITVSNAYDSLLRRTNLVTLKSGVLTSTLYKRVRPRKLTFVVDGWIWAAHDWGY
jgi:hypothetical protein